MIKLKDAISTAKKELATISGVTKECLWLYAKHTKKNTAYLLAHDEIAIEPKIFEEYLQKRGQNVPFEYITKEVGFFGYEFFVDERTLIPRPETELLVEKALELAKRLEAKSMLDICTGSGAIACSVKKEMPSLRVEASDISEGALEVARINAQRLGIDVKFWLSDLFLGIKDDNFDILTANPPYIQNGYELEENVLKEPHNALFGGEIGSEIIERIIDSFFERNFKAFVCEIGFDQRGILSSKISKHSGIKFDFYRDYAGFDRGFWIIKE